MPDQNDRAPSRRRALLSSSLLASLWASLWASLSASLAILGGCGHSQTCDFSDRPRDDVWSAVVQASRQPRYPDWVVIENQVKVDEAQHRVTVWRDLRRDVVEQGLDPRREEKQWRFSATVSEGTPSTVTFSTPDWSVPGHFWLEAAPASAARDPEAPGDAPASPKGGALAAP
jgi:hypothetical protein